MTRVIKIFRLFLAAKIEYNRPIIVHGGLFL